MPRRSWGYKKDSIACKKNGGKDAVQGPDIEGREEKSFLEGRCRDDKQGIRIPSVNKKQQANEEYLHADGGQGRHLPCREGAGNSRDDRSQGQQKPGVDPHLKPDGSACKYRQDKTGQKADEGQAQDLHGLLS
jgi:hypothetical protein